MRALSRTPRSPLSQLLLGVLVVALAFPWTGPAPAQAADARLERAEQARAEVQRRLDGLVGRMSALQSDVAEVEARLADLAAEQERAQAQADGANAALTTQLRESYKRGARDPILSLLTSGSPQQAMAQARLLGLLAKRNRGSVESATAARVRTVAAAEEADRAAEVLRSRQAELEGVRAQVARLLAQARANEQKVRAQIASEEARRRVVARTTRSSVRRTAGAAAAVVNGAACPVGSPRSYSDTWGAPRSGGRSHKGTDILAPRGTGIYAYESGTITRLSNSRLGGISIYQRGDSGNAYYYTHLQGYVSGLRAGQRVSAGEQLGFNGDSGNARGTPHLHFEVMPGGGGNVNPYPFVRRACG